jgi:hypothetical protein
MFTVPAEFYGRLVLYLEVEGMIPLKEGVVQPELDPVVSLEGGGQLAHYVSLGSNIL